MRWIRPLLFTLVFAAVVFHGHPTASNPLPQNPYSPPPNDGSPVDGVCDGVIGGGNCAGDSFGTQCDADGCDAWTTCSDGHTVTCHGDYRGQADETGVGCKDTGGDLWDEDYC